MENNTLIKLTYIGRAITSKNKVSHRYLENDGPLVALYDKMLLPHMSVGTILTAIETENGVSGPYRFVGKVTDQTLLTEWSNADYLVGKTLQLEKDIKAVSKTEYDNIVAKLNFQLSQIPSSQRKLFAMRLMCDLKF